MPPNRFSVSSLQVLGEEGEKRRDMWGGGVGGINTKNNSSNTF